MANGVTVWRRMRNNLRSLSDVWLLIRVISLATLLPVILRRLSLLSLLDVLTPKNQRHHSLGADTEFIQKAVKFTDYILERNVWIYRPNCLRRSLVLYRLLRKSGWDVVIYLGIRRDAQNGGVFEGGSLEGHAWLVYQGRPLFERNEALVDNYTVTYRFPEKFVHTA